MRNAGVGEAELSREEKNGKRLEAVEGEEEKNKTQDGEGWKKRRRRHTTQDNRGKCAQGMGGDATCWLIRVGGDDVKGGRRKASK
jgi:hypothetical protein